MASTSQDPWRSLLSADSSPSTNESIICQNQLERVTTLETTASTSHGSQTRPNPAGILPPSPPSPPSNSQWYRRNLPYIDLIRYWCESNGNPGFLPLRDPAVTGSLAITHLVFEIDVIDVTGEEVDDQVMSVERARKEEVGHLHQDLLARYGVSHELEAGHRLLDVLGVFRLEGADNLQLVVDLVQPRLETQFFGTDKVAELEHRQVQLRIVIRRVLASRQQLLQNCARKQQIRKWESSAANSATSHTNKQTTHKQIAILKESCNAGGPSSECRYQTFRGSTRSDLAIR